jgi:transcriptional regulator with XRE-family HTH domain
MKTSSAIARQSLEPAAMLIGPQIRAARALLKWTASELSERCGVSYPAIQRAESAEGMPNMQTKNLAAIKAALEAGGVVFLDDGDTRPGGPGVRLKGR